MKSVAVAAAHTRVYTQRLISAYSESSILIVNTP